MIRLSLLSTILLSLVAAYLTSCSTTENDNDGINVEIMQDVKVQAGSGPGRDVKSGESIQLKEPVQLIAPGYYPMTLVPAEAGKNKLQVKLLRQADSEVGDIQKNTNTLVSDVFRVQALIAKGKGSEAVTKIEEAKKSWPRVPMLDYLLASALVVNRDYDRAITVLDESLAKNPDATELKELKAQIKRR
jgi:predicted Zn-dependent protease